MPLFIIWKCVPLVDLLNTVMGRTKTACHLHLVLCTWDAVITCTPVTDLFQLVVQLCSKEIKNNSKVMLRKATKVHVYVQCFFSFIAVA